MRGEVVQRRVGITPTHGLDEGTDDVVMLIAVAVVAHRDPLHGTFDVFDLDASGSRECIQRRECSPRIACGDSYQMIQGLVTDGDATIETAFVFERTQDDAADVIIGERLQSQHEAA